MRAVAALFALLSLAAAGAAGYELYHQIDPRPPAHSPTATPPRDTAPQPQERPSPARTWPALFGEQKQQPAPPAAPPEPSSAPPLASLGYRLDGVVHSDSRVWALVGHPDGTRILSVGDTLEPGV